MAYRILQCNNSISYVTAINNDCNVTAINNDGYFTAVAMVHAISLLLVSMCFVLYQ